VAVEAPGAVAAVDDGLKGAEAAFSGGAAAAEVDRDGHGVLSGEWGEVVGEEFARVGGTGAGDPDVLEHVL
jgi:hypothetical protein